MLTVRWARAGERARIQRYLADNMGKLPFERWGNILDCRWIPEDDRYGAVVMDGDELCGFLGIEVARDPSLRFEAIDRQESQIDIKPIKSFFQALIEAGVTAVVDRPRAELNHKTHEVMLAFFVCL